MLKKIAYGIIANLCFIFATMFASVIRSALAVRYLPKTEAGIWFLFLSIIVLVSFCDFGLSPTLSREIGLASKKLNRSIRISNLFFTVRRLIIFISLFAMFCLTCFGYFYLYNLPFNHEQMYRVLLAFVMFGVGILIILQANPYLAVIYGVGNVATERSIRALGPLIGVVISYILVVKQSYGLYGLVFGYLFQVCSIYLLARYFVFSKVKLSKCGKYVRIIIKRIFEPSMQWTIMSIGAILIFQSSSFIIAYLIGVKYVAQFAILLQIATVIITIAGISSYVLVPFVAQAKGRGDIKTIYQFITLSSRVSGGIALVLAVFFYFFIVTVTRVWLGPNFTVNQNALLFLLIMAVLEVQHVACASIAMATGYVKFAVIALISGVLNFILSFIFIHCWGITGAAASIFISQLLTNNWYAVFISLKKLNYSIKKYFVNVIVPLLLFFVYTLLVVYGVYHLVILENIYLYLSVSIIIIAVFVCVGAWYLLLYVNERAFLMSKVRGVTSG